ncbi:MAG TPA: hypothetical protein VJ400_05910 [Thermoplasmata archaeon]|nr:hypothetical protein [Thermoplasmata archaeon]
MAPRGVGTSIEDVKRKNEAWLMKLPGVVGVGIGRTSGGRVIQILAKEITKELREKVPAEIGGFFTRIKRVGDVRGL